MFKAAVIGLGLIGYKMDEDPFMPIIWSHAKAYKKHNKTKLIAVSDIDKTRYDDFKKHYPNINFYNDYVNMVENKEIDIVSICTPTSTHLEIVRNLTKSKPPKAIFIEKPMGQNLSEANQISDLCNNNGIVLAVNYMRRWEKKYQIAKKNIDTKKYGDLQSISAYGSTALLMSTSHLIDLCIQFGGEIEWIIGGLQTDYVRKVNGENDPGGYAFVKYKNGVCAYIKGTSRDPSYSMFEIDLLFSEGRLTISDDGRKWNEWSFRSKETSSGSGYKILEKLPNNQDLIENERMLDAISDIIKCIENSQNPKSNGFNAIEVHRIIEGIKMSHSKNNSKIIYSQING